jgi:hypothetical protein
VGLEFRESKTKLTSAWFLAVTTEAVLETLRLFCCRLMQLPPQLMPLTLLRMVKELTIVSLRTDAFSVVSVVIGPKRKEAWLSS